ncbi:MAG: hypothetical protein QOG85_156 [Gaiellaceae bacterium]|jgi:hypothetical protein|nr:hypothetical protein [Gaiellaceae bacterium]
MTMIVGMGRAHEYALMTNDAMVFYLQPDGTEIAPVPTSNIRRKVRAVSDHAIAGVGGCPSIGDDFFQRLEPRLRAGDTLAAVQATAREVVGELLADDARLRGTAYVLRDTLFPLRAWRASIFDQFAIQLVGFDEYGETHVMQWSPRVGCDDWMERTGPPGQLTFGVPYGVDAKDAVPFFDEFYASQEELTLPDAFSFAFGAHRILGTKYPERLGPKVYASILRWRGHGVPPELIEFNLNREGGHDLDQFSAIHESLNLRSRVPL